MADYESCPVGALCCWHCLEKVVRRLTRDGSGLCAFADPGNSRSVKSSLSVLGEEPLDPLAPPRSYGVAPPDTPFGSTVESCCLFAHRVENPTVSNAFVPMAADVSSLE